MSRYYIIKNKGKVKRCCCGRQVSLRDGCDMGTFTVRCGGSALGLGMLGIPAIGFPEGVLIEEMLEYEGFRRTFWKHQVKQRRDPGVEMVFRRRMFKRLSGLKGNEGVGMSHSHDEGFFFFFLWRRPYSWGTPYAAFWGIEERSLRVVCHFITFFFVSSF
jgi:hypothetical protein